MQETKTAKATPDCPTLLHYIVRVLLRTEPKLVLFIEELPSVEPAARSKQRPKTRLTTKLKFPSKPCPKLSSLRSHLVPKLAKRFS